MVAVAEYRYAPKYSDDRTVRWRPIKATGRMILWHPCAACGNVDAPYGFGFGVGGSLGEWYCGKPCWPEKFASVSYRPAVVAGTDEDLF